MALPRAIFASAAWKEKREFSTFEALVDLAGLASFSARDYDYKGTLVALEARETPPLPVRFLMQRWGWKSTSTVSRFVSELVADGRLVQNSKRNTGTNGLPNTYFVGVAILACLSGTPNETSIRTPIGTQQKKVEEEGTPPTGESRGGPSANGTAKRKRAVPIPLPDDWKPSPQQRQACEDSGIDIDAVADDFRFYWRETKGTKANWDLTFTKRISAVRSTGKFRMNGNGRKPTVTSMTSTPDDAVAAAIVARMTG